MHSRCSGNVNPCHWVLCRGCLGLARGPAPCCEEEEPGLEKGCLVGDASPCVLQEDHQSLGLGEAGLPAPRDPPCPNCAVFSSRLFQDKQLRIFDPRAKPEAAQVSRVGSRAGLRLQQCGQGSWPLAHRFCHAHALAQAQRAHEGHLGGGSCCSGCFWEACWALGREGPALTTGWGAARLPTGLQWGHPVASGS